MKWNGTSWDTSGLSVNAPVCALYVYNGELYVGGNFTVIAGISAIGLAKFDGANWSAIGNMPFTVFTSVNTIAEYSGELYIGGQFGTSFGGGNLARWNGSQWNAVGVGISGGWDAVDCFEVYGNQLYIGGMFTVADGNVGNYIAKWDGIALSDVGGGLGGGQVHDLMVFNSELYVAGAFNYAGGIWAQAIAKWNGNNWCGFGDTLNNRILALASYQGELYIGGGCWIISTDTLAGVAKWIGGNYVDTCGNMTGIDEENSYSNFVVSVFPNPISQAAIFQFNGPEELRTIIIYDQAGREIWRKETDVNLVEFSAEGYSPGIYFYRVKQTEEMKASGKFIIR